MKRVKDADMQTPSALEPTQPAWDFDAIRRLRVDERLQVRTGGLDRGTLVSYEDAMRAGQAFPPLRALVVDGVLFLVDGFHRYAAAQRAGTLGALEVEVMGTGTWEEARWLAFDANRRHGLRLKSSARRDGFRAYVKTRRNRWPGGKFKSYREMGADLGVRHNTLYHWTQRDFPKLFAALRKELPGNDSAAPPAARPRLPRSVPMSGPELVRQAALLAEAHADDADANGELLEELEGLVTRLRARPHAPPAF